MEKNNNISNTNGIAVVVVTYNRASDLITCIKSLTSQTLLPDNIIIVNNRSSDDTEAQLKHLGYISLADKQISEFGDVYLNEYHVADNRTITITYIFKAQNDGGAGGFYAGMKYAHTTGYEWILLMDDDGCPDSKEIENLVKISQKHNLKYTNALVINKDNHDLLAFDLYVAPINSSYYDDIEILPGCGSPFNGTLIHSSLIDKIGYIKKEMFIWGDEVEYTARAKQHCHNITTICSARHFHPLTGSAQNMIPFIKKWTILPPSNKRARIFYRNQCYIYKKYDMRFSMFKFVTRNILGALFNLQWKYIPGMIKAMKLGRNGDFKTKLY